MAHPRHSLAHAGCMVFSGHTTAIVTSLDKLTVQGRPESRRADATPLWAPSTYIVHCSRKSWPWRTTFVQQDYDRHRLFNRSCVYGAQVGQHLVWLVEVEAGVCHFWIVAGGGASGQDVSRLVGFVPYYTCKGCVHDQASLQAYDPPHLGTLSGSRH